MPYFGEVPLEEAELRAENYRLQEKLDRANGRKIADQYQEGSPLPTSIGLCADLYAEVRELRLAMDKRVAEVKARETEICEYIIANLSKSDDTGAAGKKYRAQINVKVVPQLKDFNLLAAYVAETGRTDLLQKRISNDAVKGMWDAGEEVPGVGRFNAVDVSVTKI